MSPLEMTWGSDDKAKSEGEQCVQMNQERRGSNDSWPSLPLSQCAAMCDHDYLKSV